MNIMPRTCRGCGKIFQGGPRAWYCPECRSERKKIQSKEYRQRKKLGKTIPIGSLIKCEICGKEIIKDGGSQRFCPECAAKHLKEIDNQQSLQWKNDNPDKVREAKRKMSKTRYATGESFESSVKGVTWDKGKRKWIVKLNFGGRQYIITQTSRIDDAIKIKKESESFVIECIESIKEKYASPVGNSDYKSDYKNDNNERYRNADMSKLSDNQRDYLLDYLSGMRVQDIARKYGVKKPVVYNRIREAKCIIDTGSPHSPEEIKLRKEYARKYYSAHKEEIKEYSRRYAADHPQAVKEANRRYYEENKEKNLEKRRKYNKEYYQKNRARILASKKSPRSNSPGVFFTVSQCILR